MLDRAAAVVVQLRVVVGADVAAREDFFEVSEERRVDRHHVLEVAVNGAVLHHHDLAVALENRRLDLADSLVEQDAHVLLAVEDFLTRFAHAHGAQRVGLPRPAKRWLRLFVRLEQWFVGPIRREGGTLIDLVQRVEHHPRPAGGDGQTLFSVLHQLMHALKHRRGTGCPNYKFSERASPAANGQQSYLDGQDVPPSSDIPPTGKTRRYARGASNRLNVAPTAVRSGTVTFWTVVQIVRRSRGQPC